MQSVELEDSKTWKRVQYSPTELEFSSSLLRSWKVIGEKLRRKQNIHDYLEPEELWGEKANWHSPQSLLLFLDRSSLVLVSRASFGHE